MKNGIIGWPHVAYAVAAAVNDAIAPASVMPSSSNWPFDRLAVREHEARVDRFVLLAERRVDLELREQRVEPERARLVGDDRHDALADLGVLQQNTQQPREGRSWSTLAPSRRYPRVS